MSERLPTIQQLRVLNAVAECGSVTEASKQLCLTQPAVSISLRKLRELYDMELVETLHKQIYLTDAGRMLVDAYQSVAKRLQDLQVDIAQLKQALSGTLSISMVSSAKYFIPYAVGDFSLEHPGIQPELILSDRDNVLKRLLKNQCDFAVLSQIPDALGLEALALAENPLVLIASSKNRLSKQRKALTWSDLTTERFMTREEGSGIRASLQQLLLQHGIEPKFSMTLNSTEAIKQMVSANLGVSLVPLISVKQELEAGMLKQLVLPGLPLMKQWYLVYQKAKHINAIGMAFMQFLQQSVASYLI